MLLLVFCDLYSTHTLRAGILDLTELDYDLVLVVYIPTHFLAHLDSSTVSGSEYMES